MCKEDHRITLDPSHPQYREVVNRQLKLKGYKKIRSRKNEYK